MALSAHSMCRLLGAHKEGQFNPVRSRSTQAAQSKVDCPRVDRLAYEWVQQVSGPVVEGGRGFSLSVRYE